MVARPSSRVTSRSTSPALSALAPMGRRSTMRPVAPATFPTDGTMVNNTSDSAVTTETGPHGTPMEPSQQPSDTMVAQPVSRRVAVLRLALPEDHPEYFKPPVFKEGLLQSSSDFPAPAPLTADDYAEAIPEIVSEDPIIAARRRATARASGGKLDATVMDSLHARAGAAQEHVGWNDEQKGTGSSSPNTTRASIYGTSPTVTGGQSPGGSANANHGTAFASSAAPLHGRLGMGGGSSARGDIDPSLLFGRGFDNPQSQQQQQQQSYTRFQWNYGYKSKDERWVERVKNEIVPDPIPWYKRNTAGGTNGVGGSGAGSGTSGQTLIEYLSSLEQSGGRPVTWRIAPRQQTKAVRAAIAAAHAAAAATRRRLTYDEDIDANGLENPKRARYRTLIAELRAAAKDRHAEPGENAAAGSTGNSSTTTGHNTSASHNNRPIVLELPAYEDFEREQEEEDERQREKEVAELRQRYMQLFDDDAQLLTEAERKQAELDAAEAAKEEEEEDADGFPARSPFPTLRLLFLPECDLTPQECLDVNCLHYEQKLLAAMYRRKLFLKMLRQQRDEAAQAKLDKLEQSFQIFLARPNEERQRILEEKQKERDVEAAKRAEAEEAERQAREAKAEREKLAREVQAHRERRKRQSRRRSTVTLVLPPLDKTDQSHDATKAHEPTATPSTSVLESNTTSTLPLPLSELVRRQPERFLRFDKQRRARSLSPTHRPTAASADARIAVLPSHRPPLSPLTGMPAPDPSFIPPPLPLTALLRESYEVPLTGHLQGRKLRAMTMTMQPTSTSAVELPDKQKQLRTHAAHMHAPTNPSVHAMTSRPSTTASGNLSATSTSPKSSMGQSTNVSVEQQRTWARAQM